MTETETIKERPILFSGPMVRALLDGRKTQTRRVVKITHRTPGLAACLEPADPAWVRPNTAVELCPYGKPGERLWVRETFQPLLADDLGRYKANYKTGEGYRVSYPATDGICEFYDLATDSAFCSRMTPSIFMPRWASRITLEITEVRVQRLQDISYEDIIAEGWVKNESISYDPEVHRDAARDWYMDLWESLNGAGSWSANPWLWCVSFKVVQP